MEFRLPELRHSPRVPPQRPTALRRPLATPVLRGPRRPRTASPRRPVTAPSSRSPGQPGRHQHPRTRHLQGDVIQSEYAARQQQLRDREHERKAREEELLLELKHVMERLRDVIAEKDSHIARLKERIKLLSREGELRKSYKRNSQDANRQLHLLTEELEKQAASYASLRARMDRLRTERDRAQDMVEVLKRRHERAEALPLVDKAGTKDVRIGPDDDDGCDEDIDALRMQVSRYRVEVEMLRRATAGMDMRIVNEPGCSPQLLSVPVSTNTHADKEQAAGGIGAMSTCSFDEDGAALEELRMTVSRQAVVISTLEDDLAAAVRELREAKGEEECGSSRRPENHSSFDGEKARLHSQIAILEERLANVEHGTTAKIDAASCTACEGYKAEVGALREQLSEAEGEVEMLRMQRGRSMIEVEMLRNHEPSNEPSCSDEQPSSSSSSSSSGESRDDEERSNEVERLRNEIDEKDAEIHKLEMIRRAHSLEITETSHIIEGLRQEVAALKKSIADKEAQIQVLEVHNTTLSAEQQGASDAVGLLPRDEDPARLMQAEIGKLKEQVGQLTADAEIGKLKLMLAEREKESLAEDLRRAEDRVRVDKSYMQSLRAAIECMRGRDAEPTRPREPVGVRENRGHDGVFAPAHYDEWKMLRQERVLQNRAERKESFLS
ncbi:hypothetical protein FOZ60_015134 [Perkinsus olseni]|uniref:Uncharacterized protein n=1 Tax=Perkinsus olseni TaxID=32597 RepID=A0A7J6N621_PEROL|nr:hypothetical protein FOZ60_015134 [Perkinsus olseni]